MIWGHDFCNWMRWKDQNCFIFNCSWLDTMRGQLEQLKAHRLKIVRTFCRIWKEVKHVLMNCKIAHYLFLFNVSPVKRCLVTFANAPCAGRIVSQTNWVKTASSTLSIVILCQQESWQIVFSYDRLSVCALILIDYHVQKISFYVL